MPPRPVLAGAEMIAAGTATAPSPTRDGIVAGDRRDRGGARKYAPPSARHGSSAKPEPADLRTPRGTGSARWQDTGRRRPPRLRPGRRRLAVGLDGAIVALTGVKHCREAEQAEAAADPAPIAVAEDLHARSPRDEPAVADRAAGWRRRARAVVR